MCNIFKKHTVLLAIFMALAVSVGAQTVITPKPFTGNKGFRKWSVGINAGVLYPSLAIGGSNDFTNPRMGLGYGANLKYQFTHYFAVQADFLRGKVKGNQDEKLSDGSIPYPNFRGVKSFETEINWAGSISGVVTFGNINWLKMKTKIIPYLSAGGGIINYNPRIVERFYATTTSGTYSTSPEHDYNANGDEIQRLYIPVGIGMKVNLSKSVNLDLGYKMNFVDADNFDGYSYDMKRFNAFTNSAGAGKSQLHKDKFSYLFLGLELALGKKTQPQLMFNNPAAQMNSDLQNQIDVLRSQLNLADTDGDGVADIFDKEPNTPAGCPVDSHGVTKDTDGDGVPDCKDRQLITPTECQPVDANGVGKCPPPDCCNRIVTTPPVETGCMITDLPSLSFRGNSNTLSADAKAILASVASKLKNSPACSISVMGYPSASKASQAVCNKRTEAIRNYLMNEEGISADRLSASCEIGGGDSNTIDIKVK